MRNGLLKKKKKEEKKRINKYAVYVVTQHPPCHLRMLSLLDLLFVHFSYFDQTNNKTAIIKTKF